MRTLLARRGFRSLSHLRSPSSQRTHLVRRLSGSLVLLEESAHIRNANRHSIPFPVVARVRIPCGGQDVARVPAQGEQVVSRSIVPGDCT